MIKINLIILNFNVDIEFSDWWFSGFICKLNSVKGILISFKHQTLTQSIQ